MARKERARANLKRSLARAADAPIGPASRPKGPTKGPICAPKMGQTFRSDGHLRVCGWSAECVCVCCAGGRRAFNSLGSKASERERERESFAG